MNVRAWCVLLTALWLTGCGGGGDGQLPTTKAEGTVTLNGQPLKSGTILLHPVEAGKHATGVVQDGKFSLSTYAPQDGAVIGRHKVVLQVPEVTADGDVIPAEQRPPAEYASQETTPLTVEVSADGPPLKIEITE